MTDAVGGFLQDEGDLKVDFVAGDVPVLDHDVPILDPGALYVPQGLNGAGYGLLDGVLKALLRGRADLGYGSYAHGLLSHPFSDARLLLLIACLPPLGGR